MYLNNTFLLNTPANIKAIFNGNYLENKNNFSLSSTCHYGAT